MKWEDEGECSELVIRSPLHVQIAGAAVWSPLNEHGLRRRRNWETSIATRSSGFYRAAREVVRAEAEQALRKDAEMIVEALGGKVVWL